MTTPPPALVESGPVHWSGLGLGREQARAATGRPANFFGALASTEVRPGPGTGVEEREGKGDPPPRPVPKESVENRT